jgi:hypothetical protein
MVTAISQLRNIFPAERRTPAQDVLLGQSCLALAKGERQCIVELLNSQQNFQAYRRENLDVNDKLQHDIAFGKGAGTVIGIATGAIVGGGVGAAAGAIVSAANPPVSMLAAAGGGALLGGCLGGAAGGYAGYKLGGMAGKFFSVKEIKESRPFLQWNAARYERVALPALRQFAHIETDHRDARPREQQLQALRDTYNLRVDQQRRVFDSYRIGVDPAERDQVIRDAHMTEQEVHQVVQFYGSTSVQRSDIAYPMIREIISSGMPEEEKDFLIDFLSFPLIKDPVRI